MEKVRINSAHNPAKERVLAAEEANRAGKANAVAEEVLARAVAAAMGAGTNGN